LQIQLILFNFAAILTQKPKKMTKTYPSLLASAQPDLFLYGTNPSVMFTHHHHHYSLIISNLSQFLPEAFRTLSQACDFMPETPECFRSVAISSRGLRETVKSLRFLPGDLGTFSQRGDFMPETSGNFRRPAISCRRLRDASAALRLRAEVFGRLSRACGFNFYSPDY
jgi:hypothetical protein